MIENDAGQSREPSADPMPIDSPMPPREPRRRGAWLPSRRAWLAVAAAFALGLALCAVLLLRDRKNDGFFRAPAAAPQAEGPGYAPLPAPLGGERGEAIGLQRPAREGREDAGTDAARGTDLGRAPVAATPTPTRPAAPTASQHVVEARPIASESPAPRYPPQALRRGEEGTVNVRVAVGPDGVPTSVSLASGSGSRLLDRAALDAVRRWRFTPAQVDGRPTVGNVVVPIDFKRE